MGKHGAVWKPEDDEDRDEPQGLEYDPTNDEPLKECKVCGMAKPLSKFRLAKGGSWTATCQRCINEKREGTDYVR